MSQAETLLNSIAAYPTNDTTVSTSPINDYLIIDAEGRIINVPATETLFGVETDMNAERKHFQCPRIVGDNIDLTKLGLRISYRNAIGEEDGYVVDDVKVNGEFITFTWKLGGKLFKTKGTIYFAICAVDVDEDGYETCVWNTTLATGNVLEGLRVNLTETEEEPARDILQSLINTLRSQAADYSQRMTDEGMSWMADLESTGEGERELIESKGAETLATIPEDYTTTYNAANEALRKKAKAIVMEEEGEIISVNDASDDYVRGLKVFGKTEQVKTNGYQLFDASKMTTKTMNGITVTNNGDGSFSISGTQTGGFSTNYEVPHDEFVKLFKAGDIHIDVGQKSIPYFSMWVCSGDTVLLSDSTKLKSSTTITLTEEILSLEDSKAVFYISCASGETMTATTLRPMVYQDGDGTWEPFSGGKPSPSLEYPQELKSIESPEVRVFSKNLIQNTIKQATNAGITYTANDDGSITLNGTSTGESYYTFDFNNEIPIRNTDLNVSYEGNNGLTTLVVGYFDKDGKAVNNIASVNDKETTFLYPENAAKTRTFIAVLANTTLNNLVVRPMIRLANADSTFEKGDVQPLSISQTLSGIPVSSDGNYTDSNGQQWICDEIDFDRGVYVKRIKREVLNSERIWRTHSTHKNIYYTSFSDTADGTGVSMCTHFDNISGDSDVFENSYPGAYFEYEYSQYNKYFNTGYDTVMDFAAWLSEQEANGTPVMLDYILKTPIETPLTADELNTFRTLHTNYPNTTVLNDSGATMQLLYNADTKMFINQPRIPTFDFTEMGLSPVKYGDMIEYTNVDTSVITDALSKGPVKFKLKVLLDDDGNGVDEYIDVEFIANGTYMNDGEITIYQSSSIVLVEGMTLITILIIEGAMAVIFGGGF